MTHARPRVGIVGAGFVGAALARALADEADVWLASRSGRPRSETPHATPLALDVTDPALEVGPLAQVDRIVIGYAPGRGADRRALYLDGTRRLLHALRDAGADLGRIVWLGSTSALPDIDGWVDERCTEMPTTERGTIQREAEDLVVAHGEATATPTLVVRLAGLYGPGRELDRLYRVAPREGPVAAPRPGHGWEPTNLIHRDDAVATARAALFAPARTTGVVHACDDDHTPRRRMYDAIAARLGVAPAQWEAPVPADGVPVGKRVGNERLKAWLGVRLRHPTHA